MVNNFINSRGQDLIVLAFCVSRNFKCKYMSLPEI
uniref:Uncharacterized protein n=1 Tax=Salmonella phage vB_Si_CECAV_FGS009 TaxID=3126494 RepID=A0AAU6PY34_9CAUD